MEGRSLACHVFGGGSDVILILGGIHGDEPASAKLARALCERLKHRPLMLRGRRVVVAPAVNPDGLERNRRTNAKGVDLNRNFRTRNRRPGKRFGETPLSEPEARFIAELIARFQPARIVSIHQPLGVVDWDGPARPLAKAVSEACGLPLKKLGAKHGSLGSYAGEDLGIPIITLELPREATPMSEDAVWLFYGKALMTVILFESGS